MNLTKRYFIIGKKYPTDETERIIGKSNWTDNDGIKRKSFFAERYRIPKDKKKAERFYEEYTHTFEEAQKILKHYRRYNPTGCNSWYHCPITYLKKASKGVIV